MDDAGGGSELVDVEGDAVVEADADADDEVGGVEGFAGVGGAVHAGHARGEGVGLGEGALAHEGVDHREAGFFGELAQGGSALGADHAAAHVEDGALGAVDEVGGLAEEVRVPGGGGVVAEAQGVVALGLAGGALEDVHGDVHQHGAGAAGAGEVEGLAQHVAEVGGIFHQVVVLGDGHGDAADVGLLEGVLADQVGADLGGDRDQGDGVHVGRRDAGDEIERAGAGGAHADADFAGGAGIAVGHVRGALLVAGEVEVHPAVSHGVVELVEEVEEHAARDAEGNVGALLAQDLEDDLGAGERGGGGFGFGFGAGWHGVFLLTC
jgi:hypothetical protein